jgi:NADPH:quinone reductase-like Zn-dependent oxidoreductase
MKAIVHDRYGPPDVLRLAEVDPPVPRADEVLVRVHATAVNARDWHAMRGDPYLARLMPDFGLRVPKVRILGTDFAGVVEAVGAGVTRFHPGDEVYGDVARAFAEYVCGPEHLMDTKPANLSYAQAAAVPLAGATALAALRDHGVRPGHRVLINGASGGVGTFAVQIAKALGAHVTAVCSTRNVDLVRSLGADDVIDYRRADFVRVGGRHDLLLDLVGNRSLGDCRRALNPGGTLVLSGGGVSEGGSLLGPMTLIIRAKVVAPFVRGHRVVVLSTPAGREHLAALRDLIEAGRVTPVIDRTYKLAEAAQAISYLEVEHARAKVVLTV